MTVCRWARRRELSLYNSADRPRPPSQANDLKQTTSAPLQDMDTRMCLLHPTLPMSLCSEYERISLRLGTCYLRKRVMNGRGELESEY